MEVVTGKESKWNIDSAKDYIKKFDRLKDFYESPEYDSIQRWVQGSRIKIDGQTISMKILLSDLKEKDNTQTTKDLKQKFPEFNFENVVYGRNQYGHKTIEGVTCKKTDSEGVVHGELDGTRLNILTQNSCKKCSTEFNKEKQSIEFKINTFTNKVPKDLPLDFNDAEYHLMERPEDISQTRLVVRNIKCVSDNHEKPVILFPDWTRANEINFKFACPVCNQKKGITWKGESEMISLLKSLGYDPQKNKRIGAYSIKGTGLKNRLKADALFFKEDGTEVIAEFDGEQHFGPKAIYGGLEGFDKTVKNDTAKNKFCSENGIKLIRISFNDLGNIESELVNALSMDPMKDIYLSKNYLPLGWNNPKLLPVPIQIVESNIRKDYVFTESQLRRILESSEEEKIKRYIKKYILSNFDTVMDVNFHTKMETQSPTSPTPSLEKKVIEVTFDRSKLTFVEMLHIQYKIREDLNNYFDLKTFGRGSEWELTADTQKIPIFI